MFHLGAAQQMILEGIHLWHRQRRDARDMPSALCGRGPVKTPAKCSQGNWLSVCFCPNKSSQEGGCREAALGAPLPGSPQKSQARHIQREEPAHLRGGRGVWQLQSCCSPALGPCSPQGQADSCRVQGIACPCPTGDVPTLAFTVTRAKLTVLKEIITSWGKPSNSDASLSVQMKMVSPKPRRVFIAL